MVKLSGHTESELRDTAQQLRVLMRRAATDNHLKAVRQKYGLNKYHNITSSPECLAVENESNSRDHQFDHVLGAVERPAWAMAFQRSWMSTS